jgi:hypothetical protein
MSEGPFLFVFFRLSRFYCRRRRLARWLEYDDTIPSAQALAFASNTDALEEEAKIEDFALPEIRENLFPLAWTERML